LNLVGTDADGVSDTEERNIISGNAGAGIGISNISFPGTAQNIVAGNFIGTDVTGAAALANGGVGVSISNGASSNLIGTNGDGVNDVYERNIISGNTQRGVSVTSDSNVVAGNFIGPDVNGTAALGNGQDGVALAGDSNRVGTDGNGVADAAERNIISANTFDGVLISSGQLNVVAGNFIGTDVSGTAALGNSQRGIAIFSFSADAKLNRIGTDGDGTADSAERNVISGNSKMGILIDQIGSRENVVAGNFIGSDHTGTAALPNDQGGIVIQGGAQLNRIGTDGDGLADAAERNLISGNLSNGVRISLSGTDQNTVAGNLIGTDVTGSTAMANANVGVAVSAGAGSNQVGGSGAESNTIAFNTAAGVSVTGPSLQNAIRGNSIHSNGALGIDLLNDGVTLNDSGDGDSGANYLQNFPVIASAGSGATTRVVGILNSQANTSYTIDFYASSSADPSGFGEGEQFLGSITVLTNATGDASFDTILSMATSDGAFITATTTDPNGNTSEFSAAMAATEVEGADIQGLVWQDFNNDGQVNFGEKAIENVTITLTGTNDLGDAVNLSTTTDVDGIYMFVDLRPSDATGYTITETQPSGFVDGIDALGIVDGVPVGNSSVNDVFSGVVVASASVAENYNFGERPSAGEEVAVGQTATIGFWQNKNGKSLIETLNGGPSSTQLSTWLSTTFVNMYGDDGAGPTNPNDLTGKTNTEVADFYSDLFRRKKKEAMQLGLGGPTKMDVQVMATAFSVYVTNLTLAGTTAQSYGFLVTENGLGVSTFNVGTNGQAFDVANNSNVTVLDLLFASNDHAFNGVLYDADADGDADDDLETLLRTFANDVFSAINQAGDI